MTKHRTLVDRARHLSSSELCQLLVASDRQLNSNYSMNIYHANDLSHADKDDIVHLFEINMKRLYEQSTDGYRPDDKRKELFAEQARYLIIRFMDRLAAFVHFRFDMDYGCRVLYIYELQVKTECQGQGLGQWTIEQMRVLARTCRMSKIVLTVNKSNERAIDFYKRKCAFDIDRTDPDDDNVDYRILSCNP
jgi:N-alpha-acetyltransferase 40